MTVDKVIFQITDPDLSTMSPNQVGVETTADATTGFKMMGYKDEDNTLRRVLCKNLPAIVSYVESDGTVNSSAGYYYKGVRFNGYTEGYVFPTPFPSTPTLFYNLTEQALYTAVDSTSIWIQLTT
jgi:hypothetical protein